MATFFKPFETKDIKYFICGKRNSFKEKNFCFANPRTLNSGPDSKILGNKSVAFERQEIYLKFDIEKSHDFTK